MDLRKSPSSKLAGAGKGSQVALAEIMDASNTAPFIIGELLQDRS